MAGWFTKLRIGFALWRIRRQIKKRLREARKEGRTMDFGSLIEWVLKLKFFAKYRAKIGLAMGALGVLIPAVLSPEVIAAVPGLANAPVWLSALGVYFLGVGARYKDETA